MCVSGGSVFKAGETSSVHMLSRGPAGVFEKEQGGSEIREE